MRTQRLGTRGPEISVVGFGGWEAGGGVWGDRPVEQTLEAIRTAADSGMTWVDTAEIYGRGRSEELIAEALEGRDEVMVFTKVAPSASGFDRAGVRKGVEGSLRRLKREVIDLYQLHWPDRSVPIEETWEAMAGLVDEGLVRWIGVSNFRRELIERCEPIHHVDSLQPHFSLLHQAGRDDLFAFCATNGTGIICYGPLGYGLLTGAITAETKFGDDDWRGGGTGMSYYPELFAPGRLEKNLEIVARLRPMAERLGITLAQLALAWVAHQEGVTGAIAGSRSPKHVAENAGAGDVKLSADDLAEIDSAVGSG
ncbi:MAG TPA: aldo/keto reductase [Actinomycetota bacterium]|nr:aldo/keto reductase [Actinomycetota bacterium]